MRKTTIFYLPDAAEALLHETIMATVFDARVVSVMCLNAPTMARGRQESETDVEYACRAWSGLLPGADNATLALRMRYGWAALEIHQIVHLLVLAMDECRRLILSGCALDGTRETLSRQIERLHKLVDEWRRGGP